MARKQQPQFPDDNSPDAIPVSTQGVQRPNTNEDAGKSAQTRARSPGNRCQRRCKNGGSRTLGSTRLNVT